MLIKKNKIFEKKKISISLVLLMLTILFFNLETKGQSAKLPKSIKCAESHHEHLVRNKMVKISFWKDRAEFDTNFKGISIIFSTGFDSITNFKISINKKLLKSFKCKTNYSIGYCVNDNYGTIENVFLSYNEFKESDSMRIQVGNEFFSVKLLEKMKSYNNLTISKTQGAWYLQFEKKIKTIPLE